MQVQESVRQLSFRPFRRVGDKLVVTSYMGWRKIYTANICHAKVLLLPFPEIKKDEIVYATGKKNYWKPSKFEPLLWPVNGRIRLRNGYVSSNIYKPLEKDEVYSMLDYDGCPLFSHKTSVCIAENYPEKLHLFEPLTADIVYRYFEIMRDDLYNIEWEYSTR